MKEKLKNKNQGITLIALIITIIVMLILVVTAVSVTINSGLFEKAGDATTEWNTAEKNLVDEATSHINETVEKLSTVTKIIEATESSNEYIKNNENITSVVQTKTTSKTYEAPIPAGFTVSGIENEQNIEKGLVIYKIPEGSTIDWTNTEVNMQQTYDQFVWIPVEVAENDTTTSVANFYRSEWVNNKRGESLENSTDLIEPYSTGEGDTAEQDYANAVESVYKNHGFYMARYEAGTVEARTSSSPDTETFSVKKGLYPYNYIHQSGAKSLCKNLYSDLESVTSMLCLGTTWDSTMDFIKETHDVTDSTSWGNYSDTLSKTGMNEINCSKNIYDLAGYCAEWTQEWGVNYPDFTKRGGEYDCGRSTFGASSRYDADYIASVDGVLTIYYLVSFRPVLFVN